MDVSKASLLIRARIPLPAIHPVSSILLRVRDTDYAMSTGGAPIKAIIKTEVATRRQGIIRTPNHPTYNLLFVEVTQEQKSFHTVLD